MTNQPQEAAVTEMVERVARALYEARGANSFPWETRVCMTDDLSVEVIHLHRDLARAAIAAMRSPTGEILEAGEDARKAIKGGVSTGLIWQAMIDAALGNTSPPASDPPPAPVLDPEATSGRGDGGAAQRPNVEA